MTGIYPLCTSSRDQSVTTEWLAELVLGYPDHDGGRHAITRAARIAWDQLVSFERMDLTSMIETRPGVRSGKPCFIGTRIAVYDVLDYLASGMTTDEIVHDFPELTPDRVRAAIGFAAMRERRLATPA